MSATDDSTAAIQGTNEGFESLTLTLQQIAASAQTNSETFETQKKQFIEQFSQLFGSLNSLQQNSKKESNTVVSPSNESPTVSNRPPSASTPRSTTPMLSLPNFKKQNSNCNPLQLESLPNVLPLNQLNFTPNMPPPAPLSVPMSLISNGSHSTMYQYPYITSTPVSITNTTIKSPNMLQTTLNTIHNRNRSNTTAYESYWMRRILSNILLLFFRYHPNGVLSCELSQFYSQMFNEELIVTTDLKYLLCVHKSILITNTKERGQLYTLNDDQIPLFLQEFEIAILEPWIVKHIRRLFRCFPNGIACHCLEDLLFNMVQFRLSAVMPSWHEFVCNIAAMYCCNINGVNMFIVIDLEDLNKQYAQFKGKRVEISANNIQYYLSSHLNYKNILRRPVGYCELLIVLLASYYTTDANNAYYKGIDGETLEKAFHSSYQSRLVHEAPFIQDVLGKICEITVIKKDSGNGTGEPTKLYKLLASSKQYFETQPDAFAPILNRSLELVQNKAEDEDELDANTLPQSPFKEDHVSVFMGGFGHGTTVDDLRIELAKKGITMISCSGISYRNYGWSFVTLSNDKEAQYLISVSPIQIAGRMIDIRPFINRQRVRNHIGNKPSNEAMLNAMIDLLNKTHDNDGLTVADIQAKLFRKFSYRIDGPELTKIVGDNPRHLHIKRHQTERIYWTPKLPATVTTDELMIKINKLWKHIKCNYYGNVYHEQILNEYDIIDNDEYGGEASVSNKSQRSSNKSNKSNESNGSNPSNPSNPSAGSSKPKANQSEFIAAAATSEYTISESDFENEFARRYRLAVQPTNFGFNSVKELLDSMDVPFNVIIYDYHLPEHMTYTSKIKPYTTISGGYNSNKHKLNINVHNNNSNHTNKTNMTSPRYINSPSNFSNHSFKSNPNYSMPLPPQMPSTGNSSPFTPYNSTAATAQPPRTIISPPASQSNVYAAAQLLQHNSPYIVAATNSVTNYSLIPSVPNTILTSNSNINLNANIIMNMNAANNNMTASNNNNNNNNK